MSDEALQRALACAKELVELGESLLRSRNEASLRARRLARAGTEYAKKDESQRSLALGD